MLQQDTQWLHRTYDMVFAQSIFQGLKQNIGMVIDWFCTSSILNGKTYAILKKHLYRNQYHLDWGTLLRHIY